MGKILDKIQSEASKGKKSLAILVDPDALQMDALELTIRNANLANVDYFFVGGSMISDDCMDETISYIKKNSSIPVVIFPGSVYQIHEKADAILFLSLISGRNAEMLIGKQVLAAPIIKKSGIEALSTGYMLIDGGQPTTAYYISNSFPIPANKPTIAGCTAMAGEMLGLSLNFLDAGSGASLPVSEEMISVTKSMSSSPLIVGGGIYSAEKAKKNWLAGADIVVIGTAFENNPTLIQEVADSRF